MDALRTTLVLTTIAFLGVGYLTLLVSYCIWRRRNRKMPNQVIVNKTKDKNINEPQSQPANAPQGAVSVPPSQPQFYPVPFPTPTYPQTACPQTACPQTTPCKKPDCDRCDEDSYSDSLERRRRSGGRRCGSSRRNRHKKRSKNSCPSSSSSSSVEPSSSSTTDCEKRKYKREKKIKKKFKKIKKKLKEETEKKLKEKLEKAIDGQSSDCTPEEQEQEQEKKPKHEKTSGSCSEVRNHHGHAPQYHHGDYHYPYYDKYHHGICYPPYYPPRTPYSLPDRPYYPGNIVRPLQPMYFMRKENHPNIRSNQPILCSVSSNDHAISVSDSDDSDTCYS